ncbi:MAG: sulfite exporter TauE/SafE family protein [Ilumatobacteraceae bacterium]
MILVAFTATQISIVAGVIFFAAIVTAVAGFGFGLMSVPLMSLVIDIHSAVIVSSIVAVGANGVQALLYRRSRNQRLVIRLSLACFLGLPFGFIAFQLVGDSALRIALGVGVVVAVVMLSRGLDLAHFGPRMDWVLGFISGCLNTSISTSGPPLVFDLQARKLHPEAFRGTINTIFLISGSGGLVVFWLGDKIHGAELEISAAAAPALALGLLAGMPLRKLFSPERFRVLVMGLLVVSALAAVSKVFT